MCILKQTMWPAEGEATVLETVLAESHYGRLIASKNEEDVKNSVGKVFSVFSLRGQRRDGDVDVNVNLNKVEEIQQWETNIQSYTSFPKNSGGFLMKWSIDGFDNDFYYIYIDALISKKFLGKYQKQLHDIAKRIFTRKTLKMDKLEFITKSYNVYERNDFDEIIDIAYTFLHTEKDWTEEFKRAFKNEQLQYSRPNVTDILKLKIINDIEGNDDFEGILEICDTQECDVVCVTKDRDSLSKKYCDVTKDRDSLSKKYCDEICAAEIEERDSIITRQQKEIEELRVHDARMSRPFVAEKKKGDFQNALHDCRIRWLNFRSSTEYARLPDTDILKSDDVQQLQDIDFQALEFIKKRTLLGKLLASENDSLKRKAEDVLAKENGLRRRNE